MRRPGRYLGSVLAKVLSVVGRLFIVTGLLLLGFVAFQLWGTGLEHGRNQDELASGFTQTLGGGDTEVSAEGPTEDEIDAVLAELARLNPETVGPIPTPPQGEASGIIRIPKIGVDQVMVEGVSKSDLKKGPGHYPGTPSPGQAGNVGVAGHRTTYGAPFNRIDELAPGDEILAYTPQGEFRYEVMAPPAGKGIEQGPGWYTVRPSQAEVLNDAGDNRITLTACHPKRSAKQRIIVHARLVGSPAAAPPPEPAPVDEGEIAAPPEPDEDPSVVGDEEIPEELFAGDGDAKWPAMGLGGGAIAMFFLFSWLGSRMGSWRRWAMYAAGTPLTLVLVWYCFVYADRFLPSF